MSSKKITWHYSRTISEAIANKAFEHLINPVEIPMKAIAKQVVANTKLDWEVLKAHSLVGDTTGSEIAVDILPASYTVPDGHEITVRIAHPYNIHRYDNMRFFGDEAYDQLIELQKTHNVFIEKREALRVEIHAQIEGKTVNAVCKAWPEAEQIIKRVMGIGEGSNLTRPLEDLLKRFLPMLPAPATEGT